MLNLIRVNALDLLEELLKLPYVDPSIDDNAAITSALSLGYFAIADRLLNDPRVSSSFENYERHLPSTLQSVDSAVKIPLIFIEKSTRFRVTLYILLKYSNLANEIYKANRSLSFLKIPIPCSIEVAKRIVKLLGKDYKYSDIYVTGFDLDDDYYDGSATKSDSSIKNIKDFKDYMQIVDYLQLDFFIPDRI